jgi:DNA-binding protein YbaB
VKNNTKKQKKLEENKMGFEFRNRMITIDIAGIKLEIDSRIGDELARRKDDYVAAATKYAKGEKTARETIEYFAEQINKALGDGAFEKISEIRDLDVRDCIDVMTYIATEVGAFNKKSALTVIK